ncbi:MAG TPA: diacylglycerol kinase family protein [Acidimicrobiales bacterium]|nr:diacylglycerol kinase family protein [Acidimicrobiales bacterium]
MEQVHRGEFEAVVPRARLWAVVSLLAGLGLLAAVVAFLARNGVYVVVGVAGVALSVTGSWWAITGRSFRRAAGSVGLAVGVAVLAVALLRAGQGWASVARLAVALVLLAVAAGAARAALAAQLRATAPAEHRLAPPAHPVLLCNPWSGGGKVKTFGLEELASSMGVETVMLDRGLDLEQLARDAVDRGADCLGMAGGDGSQALVASIAVEKGLPFVCVTAGTRNHFALDLGLDRDDPRRSVHAFGDAIERRIDYATVNDRFFVNNVSLGIYATIVQQEGYREAKAETTRRLVPEMLGDRTDPFDLQFTTPDGREVDGAFLIQVSNNPYVLGPSLDVSQRRRLDSGRLGVFAISANTGAQAAEVLTLALAGQESRSGSAFQFECETFEVRSRSGTAYAGVDGEALELATPLRFQIHRLGLRLLVPAGNLEAARRRQAREIRVRDLVQLARGRTEEVAAR